MFAPANPRRKLKIVNGYETFLRVNALPINPATGGVSVDRRIDSLKEYLTERFAEQLGVEEMAARVNLSPSRLAHLFKRETGTAPREFLKQIRMKHARTLLEGTFLSVKEVMARCGFNDASHFVRDFERQYGTTPRRYRTHHLERARRACSSSRQRRAEPANEVALRRSEAGSDSVGVFLSGKP